MTYSPLTYNQRTIIFMPSNFYHMNIKSKFGNRLRYYRKQKKYSQEYLALKAGIDRTYITSVENGKRNISIKNIEKILIALEINFSDFFKEIE